MSSAVGDVQHALSSTPYIFLQPTPALHAGFLQLAKRFLDPLANDITEAQVQRQKLARQNRKRKRGAQDGGSGELLRMKKIHVDGFEVDQVWQQARRVLHAANEEVERELPQDSNSEEDSGLDSDQPSKRVRCKDDGLEVGEDDEEEMGEEGVDYEVEGIDTDEYDEDGGDLNGGEDEKDLDNMDEEDYETPESDVEENEARQEVFVKDPHGLNDGFFSIDHFNKTSQFMEQQDERGEDDAAASDEEDIDWGSNPFAFEAQAGQEASTKKQKPSRRQESPEEDSEDDEGGPTFGNMALDAPEGESDIDMDDDDDAVDDDDMNMGGNDNANNIMYTDFFAPPATSKKAKSKKRSENEEGYKQRKQQRLATEGNADAEEAALDRVMTAAQRDLLNEDASDNDDDVSLSPDEYDAAANDDANAPPTRGNLSTHERRQLALRSEIRKLEAAAVASKPWYLTGESVAVARPENALLEEDLEFERAGKPVPVITEEISEDIEALIKRRILAREFDEIPRRRPGDAGGEAATKRGKIPELSDQKSKQGLADEYEADLLARTDPNYVDTRTEALKAQHKAIEGLWAAVSSQLDALSNWHYKPKPAAASLEVRVDVPTVAMEDARPTAGGDVNTSALAPQEVYRPGEDGADGSDVVRTKGGNAVAREEMSKEQKVRRRRREKERQKKAGMNEGESAKKSGNIVGNVADGSKVGKGGKSRESQRDVEAQLKKGGAQIIDKKGALRDVEGNLAKGSRGADGGIGALRL